ncbi:MAG TPA: hypothetical protein VGQ46_10710 [Thermoanaerobaculia bacterium]|nr:hypothetical protein [Thermoanaerobaculia bacterium]
MLLMLATTAAIAQPIAATNRGIVVAHDHVIELFDRTGRNLIWKTDGLPTPQTIVASNVRIAVIDPLANEVRIVELATGRATAVRTGETPVAGVFIGPTLYLLERDARALERIGADGTRASISTGADPAFLREANGRLYVYARGEGVVQEVSTMPFAIRRSVRVTPFASDFEIDSKNAYIVDPHGAKIGIINLESMQSGGSIDVGAVPVSFAFVSTGTSLTARTLAVADPSAKKVWLIEGAQSVTQAFTRGFLRGLIGLGLFGSGTSSFPTGVDRVFVRGTRWYAFDSSSGTLYRFTKSSSSAVAKNIRTFTVTTEGVVWWNDAVRRLQQAD